MQPKTEDMLLKKNLLAGLGLIIKQGPSFLIISLFLYFFVERYDRCNEEMINLYKEQNQELVKVVQQNADAFKDLSIYLRMNKE